MTPRDPTLVDPLAAEYVLGTLRGPARRRFERWLATSELVQERCRFWEESLIALVRGVRAIQPPAHVWEGIRSRLNLGRAEVLPSARPRPARSLAIAASILLVVGLAALVYWRGVGPGPITETASIAATAGSPVWRIEVHRNSGRLVVHAGRVPPRLANQDYELWALPADSDPVSLGVLPVIGTGRRTLTPEQTQAILNTKQVAVTLEQTGGSATGKPTSKPIFVAPLNVVS